ncbi:elongation factor G [Desulfovibrio ferrophilus]|uniref:Elongation factor G n=1 Tax=Desulfovibrio ferrophilus TaxID=241368 RepID=A0A2Z6AX12_9BACT|nr:elongation factor G [Desulfovibrio ferrophilus]BBD07794.1 translation elongation factor G [Desulfovibrio ferrophilus]
MGKKPVAPKNYLQDLRNIGIIAHIDAGKTTLTERILYYSGKIHRLGEVHEGTATMDFMPEEQERGITIGSACTTCHWQDSTINIIDTPGHVDFTIEVERSLRVLDGAVGVFCAVGGVEPQSETVWRQSQKYHVPKLAFINKMDRLGADFEAVLTAMRNKLKVTPLPMIIPVGEGQDFEAIIDLVSMKKIIFDQSSKGEKYSTVDLSETESTTAETWREQMLEILADADEEFLAAYMEGEITAEDVHQAVRRATLSLALVPVFTGSALKNVGVQQVLDAVCRYLPSPGEVPPQQAVCPLDKTKVEVISDPGGDLAALAFKVSMDTGRKLVLMRIYSGVLQAGETVYNVTQDKDERVARLFHLHAGRKEKTDHAFAGEIVAAAGMKFSRTGDTLSTRETPVILENIEAYKPVISLALEPRNSAEADKLEEVLAKMLMEDPTLATERDEETDQLVISGMGELHLEVVLERIRREYGVEPRAGKPQVVYQETVRAQASADGIFDRELGDEEHYGHVSVRVAPLPRSQGCDVVFEMDTTDWPEAWVQAVADGLEDGMQSGVLRGYPLQDVRITVTGMRRENGKSSPVGYHMAAVSALKDALAAAKPILLEPLMAVEIGVPEEFVGEVISLFGAKGAKIDNMFDQAGQKVVQALAPLRQLFGFSTALRSATQGRAGMMMKFSRFDVLD